MNCENCKKDCKPEEQVPAMVPLYAVEGSGYRREKTLRGTVVVFCVALLVIVLLVGTFGWFAYKLHIQSLSRVEAINQRWIDYLENYDFSGDSYEYSQDGRGINVMGSGNGVDYYVGDEVTDDGPAATDNSETADP